VRGGVSQISALPALDRCLLDSRETECESFPTDGYGSRVCGEGAAVSWRSRSQFARGSATTAPRRLVLPLTIAAILVSLSGCGQERPHQVRLGIEQLGSIAAEGALMADDVARARTKVTFVRVHGEELSAQAQHEAEKLNDDPVAHDLHARVQVALALASSIGSAIDDVRTSPQDRAQARAAEPKLQHAASQASKLAGTLP
jgi:hypothetical protein